MKQKTESAYDRSLSWILQEWCRLAHERPAPGGWGKLNPRHDCRVRAWGPDAAAARLCGEQSSGQQKNPRGTRVVSTLQLPIQRRRGRSKSVGRVFWLPNQPTCRAFPAPSKGASGLWANKRVIRVRRSSSVTAACPRWICTTFQPEQSGSGRTSQPGLSPSGQSVYVGEYCSRIRSKCKQNGRGGIAVGGGGAGGWRRGDAHIRLDIRAKSPKVKGVRCSLRSRRRRGSPFNTAGARPTPCPEDAARGNISSREATPHDQG
jgi:hypothetical protein